MSRDAVSHINKLWPKAHVSLMESDPELEKDESSLHSNSLIDCNLTPQTSCSPHVYDISYQANTALLAADPTGHPQPTPLLSSEFQSSWIHNNRTWENSPLDDGGTPPPNIPLWQRVEQAQNSSLNQVFQKAGEFTLPASKDQLLTNDREVNCEGEDQPRETRTSALAGQYKQAPQSGGEEEEHVTGFCGSSEASAISGQVGVQSQFLRDELSNMESNVANLSKELQEKEKILREEKEASERYYQRATEAEQELRELRREKSEFQYGHQVRSIAVDDLPQPVHMPVSNEKQHTELVDQQLEMVTGIMKSLKTTRPRKKQPKSTPPSSQPKRQPKSTSLRHKKQAVPTGSRIIYDNSPLVKSLPWDLPTTPGVMTPNNNIVETRSEQEKSQNLFISMILGGLGDLAHVNGEDRGGQIIYDRNLQMQYCNTPLPTSPSPNIPEIPDAATPNTSVVENRSEQEKLQKPEGARIIYPPPNLSKIQGVTTPNTSIFENRNEQEKLQKPGGDGIIHSSPNLSKIPAVTTANTSAVENMGEQENPQKPRGKVYPDPNRYLLDHIGDTLITMEASEVYRPLLKMTDQSIKVVEAIRAGDVDLLHDLWKSRGFDVDTELYNGQTPLALAVSLQKIAVVDMLLCMGANVYKHSPAAPLNPNLKEDRGSVKISPLQIAVIAKNIMLVEMLFNKGPCVDLCKGGVKTLLFLAVKYKAYDLVQKLVATSREDDSLIVSYLNLSAPLRQAVLQRDTKMVQLLVNLGADVNRELDSIVPIVYSANNSDLRMCLALLNHGASLDSCFPGEQLGTLSTPLSCAIKAGMDNAVSMLLKLGSDPNAPVNWNSQCDGVSLRGSCVLHFAMVKNNLSVVRKLVSAGAKLSQKDDDGNCPLHLACRFSTSNKTDLVEYLVDYKAQREDLKQFGDNDTPPVTVDMRNKKGQTPLMVAVQARNPKAVQILLQSGANPDLFDTEKKTALHLAVLNNSEEIVLLLLRAGCNVDGGVTKGHCYTPLHFAVRNSALAVGEILISEGANMHFLTRSEETLFHLAVTARSEEFVKLCLQKNLDVNARMKSWDTPLMLAARQDNTDICQLLIEGGASLNMKDRNQETALSLSTYFGFEDNARLLIINGAGLNIADKRKTTPLYWSIFNCRVQTLKLLILAGARFTIKDLYRYPKNLSVMKNKPLFEWMRNKLLSVPTLQDCCRHSIRKKMIKHGKNIGIAERISKLPLPSKLIAYLLFSDEETKEKETEVHV